MITKQSVVGGAAPQNADRGSLRMGLLMAGVVVALVAGFALGRVVPSPTGPASPGAANAPTGGMLDHTHPPGTAPHDHGAMAGASDGTMVGGLSISAGEFHLVPLVTSMPVGVEQDFRFQVRDAEGKALTDFAIVHEKPMHMIVTRRDLSGYQHVHPEMTPDGTWSVPLTLPKPGVWRVFADFAVVAKGRQTAMALGTDLVVAGDYQPRDLPADSRTATVGGFEISYEGAPRVGAAQPLLFRVRQGGAPAALEPYLGAYGHLVAVREGDLGYLHVHPEGGLVDGAVKFWLATPSPGRYRFFLDFQVAGEVHVAEFTLTMP